MHFSEKQKFAFANSNANINIAAGAVSSGKSYIWMYRFLDEIRKGPKGDGSSGYDYMIAGKTNGSVLRNVFRPLDKELGGILKFNHSQQYFNLWGNKVYVIGANDERAHGKIQGWTLAGALIDEGALSPESFFNMTLSRLRVDGAKLFVTTNPESKYHWLKTEFIDYFADDPKELAHFHFVMDDNPVLTESYKNSLKKQYRGIWYKRYIDGEWVQAEGAVFDFFDEKIHTVREAPTYAKYYIVGIDYGTTNPFAAVLIGFNDDHHPTLWIEKEYYWDSKLTNYQKTDSEYCRELMKAFEGYPIKMFYLDPSAQSFEVEMKRNHLPVKQAKNDVLDGIRFVSNLLSQGDLVIKKNNLNLLKEIESYVWDEKAAKLGEDKPIKQRDHAIDAMRYGLFTHFGQKHSLKENTVEERNRNNWYQNPMASPGMSPTNSWGWQSASGF